MWPKIMSNRRTGECLPLARRMALSLLVVLPITFASEVSAKGLTDCPQAVPTPSNIQPHTMPLKEILRLPNRPNPKQEGAAIITEGYLTRIKEVKSIASPCPPLPESSTRIWLATRKPTTLKGRVSRHRAFVAIVPTAMIKDRLGDAQTSRKLIGKKIRIVGVLTFNSTRSSALMKTRGSLWELGAVSDLTVCPGNSCPALPPQ